MFNAKRTTYAKSSNENELSRMNEFVPLFHSQIRFYL